MQAPAVKNIAHVAVRFYKSNAIDLAIVPLLEETAGFTRGAGDGYFLVVLLGEPGTAYPLDLQSPGAFDARYLAEKFHLDRRGFGYTPEELALALQEVTADLRREGTLD
ncbi:MAG: hypothetical protein CL897_06480 [Dehalococcoidia bacterium]|nr:hypothetical protein [Dehalococcoidia bacterium]HCV00341.1 hypothetical protein [Dehalococcoidia bacterium]|tara:strand:- start:150 stop:476 length:327 start_codon:yes stop_codon:yes gene_type:complete